MKVGYQRRKDKRPAEILAAASEVFSRSGFSAAKMSDIAAQARISRPTLYLYFANKDAIFQALMREIILPVFKEAEAGLGTFNGPADVLLERTITTVLRHISRPPALGFLKLVVTEGHHFPEMMVLYKAEVVERVMALLGAIIARGVASAEFRPDAADIDLRVLMAPGALSVVWASLFGALSPAEADRLIQSHIDILKRGLRRDDGPPGHRSPPPTA